jgi:prophage maintenance system killer protein
MHKARSGNYTVAAAGFFIALSKNHNSSAGNARLASAFSGYAG